MVETGVHPNQEAPTSVGRVVEALTGWSSRWIPGSFAIACILTLITFGAVLLIQQKSPAEALGFWTHGFWHLLELTMQMGMILLTGYMMAVSPLASRVLSAIAGLPKSTLSAIVFMGLVSMLLNWMHWGLGLVGAPIFLRFLVRKHPSLDYRLAVAAACLGSGCTWHAGLSGSSTLMMATPGHFMEKEVGVIPMTATTFTAFNLILTVVVVLTATAVLVWLNPKSSVVLPPVTEDGEDGESTGKVSSHAHSGNWPEGSFTQWIESGYALNLVMGLLGVTAWITWVVRDGFRPSLNLFNFIFVFVALLLHPSPRSFSNAATKGMEYLQGIVVQFPLYAGMHGLIQFSGLAATIGGWFVSIANPLTFPLITYWYSGVLSYFIPSGGSKWVVEAPFILAAAKSLGVPPPQVLVAYIWGDMSTHFLQPFWAIPVLAITRLEFKDILGNLVILFLVNSVVVSLAMLLMPYVF